MNAGVSSESRERKRLKSLSHSHKAWHPRSTPTSGAGSGASQVMMLFQWELGWSLLELLGRSAVSGCRAPLQKRETKRIGGGLLVVSLMPKSVLSGGRED